jgi:hypothetical protein
MVICSIPFIVTGFIKIHECNKDLKRNEEVYDYRVRMIKKDYEEFLLLPSYDKMLEDRDTPVDGFAIRERMLHRMRKSV